MENNTNEIVDLTHLTLIRLTASGKYAVIEDKSNKDEWRTYLIESDKVRPLIKELPDENEGQHQS